MENSKYVAKLKEQLQIINSMIDEAEEGTPDEPSSDDSNEQRIADLENEVKNIKSRLDKLEKVMTKMMKAKAETLIHHQKKINFQDLHFK